MSITHTNRGTKRTDVHALGMRTIQMIDHVQNRPMLHPKSDATQRRISKAMRMNLRLTIFVRKEMLRHDYYRRFLPVRVPHHIAFFQACTETVSKLS